MITIERVMRGYEKSGLIPTTGSWLTMGDDGTKCGCAVTAILVGEGHMTFEKMDGNRAYLCSKAFEQFLYEKVGIPSDDVWLFIAGFDANFLEESPHELKKLGHQCQREIFAHYA